MADDKKIPELNEATTTTGTEFIPIVTDPAGTAEVKKISSANFFSTLLETATAWLAGHSTAGAHTVDTISEKTGGAGVTIDGVLNKDGGIQATADIVCGTRLYSNSVSADYADTSAHDILTTAFTSRNQYLVNVVCNLAGTLYSGLYYVTYYAGVNVAAVALSALSATAGTIAISTSNNKITVTGANSTSRNWKITTLGIGIN